MMKNIAVLICCLSGMIYVHAQDLIFKSNGKVVEGLIREVNQQNVNYRLPGDTVTQYVISKTYVDSIRYAGGSTIVIDHTLLTAAPGQAKTVLPSDTLNNKISLFLTDMFFSLFSVEYERFLPRGNFSIKIPLSVGFNALDNENFQQNAYYTNKVFSTGIGVNFHFPSSGALYVYAGPDLVFGKYGDVENSYETVTKRWFVSGILHGGAGWLLPNHMFVEASVGTGATYSQWHSTSVYNSAYDYRETIPDFRGGLKLGVKF